MPESLQRSDETSVEIKECLNPVETKQSHTITAAAPSKVETGQEGRQGEQNPSIQIGAAPNRGLLRERSLSFVLFCSLSGVFRILMELLS